MSSAKTDWPNQLQVLVATVCRIIKSTGILNWNLRASKAAVRGPGCQPWCPKPFLP